MDGPRVKATRKRPVQARTALTPEQTQRAPVAFAAVGAALAVFLVWSLFAAAKFNLKRYPGLLRIWQSSFICRPCGAVFQPANAEQIMLHSNAES